MKNEDPACKTPRWRLLKTQLNNLLPHDFIKKWKATPDAILIDVRTPTEFQQQHIEGAVNISYLDEFFWDKIEKIDPHKPVFVYCRTGRRSIRACTLMRNGGFDATKIFNMDGGCGEWLRTHTH